MKKSILLIAFLLAGFFCFGQNERPYFIKYKTQSDTVYLNTQQVNSIHVDAIGQDLIHDNGTEYTLLKDMDTVYVFRGSETVNSNYVPIDWGDATLIQSNDSVGDYQIQFNGEVPELQPGSIITIDQDSIVHYIFIETVEVTGNLVNLTSTEAYLTDIFADVDFTLTTAEGGKSSEQGNVFYPEAAYIIDENGVYRALDLGTQREDGWGFTHDLWQYGTDFNGEVLCSGNNFSIFMEQLSFNFDIDLEMYMNFSGRDVHEIVGNAIDRYRSRALNVNALLLGSFDTEQKPCCNIQGSCSFNPGYEIWKHNLFRPLSIRFLVYGVPVIITLNSDLYRQIEMIASGEISACVDFTDNAQGQFGFEWHQGDGINPVASFSNTYEFSSPTVEGKGTVLAKVHVFPRVRLLLYDVVGPSFDIKPYLSTILTGGFREELLGQGNDYCAWSFDFNTGLDACCGLSLQFMGYEIQNYSTPIWNIVDRPLYHSPQSIQYTLVKRKGVEFGQRNIVHFNVYDHNYLFNTDVITPLWQFVQFEGDGEISSGYGITSGGTVSVDWTPTSNNDKLYAKLYDLNGNVMASDEVTAEITVYTWLVNNITPTTANGRGYIDANEFVNVLERGICWNTYGNPNVGNAHECFEPAAAGNFNILMDSLTPNTTYYVRAYALLGTEYLYGNEVSFTTLDSLSVMTSQVTNITQTTALGGGNVTNDGGSSVTERGICWSTNHNPTISDSHATSGTGTGSFTVNMTDLTENTTYYVRAYAINSIGTVYGDEVNFTTLQNVTPPMVITAQVTNITQTTATGGGMVTSDGGSSTTVRGICWSTSHYPTTSNSHANSGTGTGSFTVNMTGLTSNTTYYVRAYAINSAGTTYGMVVSFTTESEDPNWVDLGLPSGLLWATHNVGANSPEDFGYYYAWGETQPKSFYEWNTYGYCCNSSCNSLTKYCNSSNYGCNGYSDNLTILQLGDDAAFANCGGDVRTPTKEEWQELIGNCASCSTTLNGVPGIRFVGPNGNILFLPAAGERWDSEFYGVGISCSYRSSTLSTVYPCHAYVFLCDPEIGAFGLGTCERCGGFPVRPVRSAK